jgi:hypothetical protein
MAQSRRVRISVRAADRNTARSKAQRILAELDPRRSRWLAAPRKRIDPLRAGA